MKLYYPDSASASLPVTNMLDIPSSPTTTTDIIHDSPINTNLPSLHDVTSHISDSSLPPQHHISSPNSPINLTTDDEIEPDPVTVAGSDIHDQNLTRPVRQKHTPSYLNDYVCNTSSNHAEAIPSGTLYPIAYFHSFG
ncbi:hypothetical protein P8452_17410 [Trifolium repens]|nr:hypothetical protein P8452_17410 [Trifolium repens]